MWNLRARNLRRVTTAEDVESEGEESDEGYNSEGSKEDVESEGDEARGSNGG